MILKSPSSADQLFTPFCPCEAAFLSLGNKKFFGAGILSCRNSHSDDYQRDLCRDGFVELQVESSLVIPA